MIRKADVTCIILTKNEEQNLQMCIDSIKDFAARIIVVDSGSTDRTLDIAKENNCEVFEHPFESYAHQYNWVLDNIEFKTKWIYRIDADEVVYHALAEELVNEMEKHADDEVNGFVMKFEIYFLGKLLKHAGNYPFYNLVVWKTGKGRYTERYMGEHAVLSEGTSITLKNVCEHHDFKSLDIWVNKHNWYSTRETIDYKERHGENDTKEGLYDNAKKTQKVRDGFYYRLPLFFRAKMYYWYRYYIKLGFLDGKPGKVYCWLQAYWYRFLVDAKIYETKVSKKDYDKPGSLK